MPSLSQRAHILPASPIRKLAPFAQAARERGVRVFQLNIGQPDIPTPPQYFEAIQQANLPVLEYSPSPGFDSLRKAIATYYCDLGYPIDFQQVLVTTGASEALNFLFASILNPHDQVIIPEPFYANYQSFSLANDAQVVPITTDIEHDFALPPIEQFEAKITAQTKAILICNPGNPTGVLYPRESLEKLQQLCLKHDLFLISDEVYREFTYGGDTHHSILSLPGMEEHAVVVDSISKRFSACGARIGCLVSRNAELLQAILKMAQARLSPPTFGQIGAEAVYRLPADYYQSVVAQYAQRRDTLVKKLGEIPGVVCPRVNGAFYAMVKLPVRSAEHFCQWLLESFQRDGQTVMMAPGEGFYATPGLGTQEVRIAYVLCQQDLEKAIDVLKAALEVYPERID